MTKKSKGSSTESGAPKKSSLLRKICKGVVWTVGTILAIVLLTVAVLLIFLNPIAKFAVEKVGPKILGVDLRVEKIRVDPLRGRIEIREFYMDNPRDKGYGSDCAIHLGHVDAEVDIKSVLKNEKIIIRDVTLKNIHINYEADLFLNSNIQDIINNINALKSEEEKKKKEAEQKGEEPPAEVRLQVDHFVLDDVGLYIYAKGASVGAGIPLTIDPIGPLGTDPEGISPFDFALDVMLTILVDSAKQGGIKISDHESRIRCHLHGQRRSEQNGGRRERRIGKNAGTHPERRGFRKEHVLQVISSVSGIDRTPSPSCGRGVFFSLCS